MDKIHVNDMIYALATPWAKSAIAVIRVSGDLCIQTLADSFETKTDLLTCKSNQAVFGHLKNKITGQKIDDCIITLYKNGHGYTGEESMEISCHGGLETIKAILAYLQSLGMRQAQGGEFTLRAFLHNKMDLTKAEAVNELINSRASQGRVMALNRLSGALYERISQIKALIAQILSLVEVQLDYAEDEIEEDMTFPIEDLDKAIEMLGTVSSSYATGKLYSQGARIVLAGSANAGKSSLFNYFLKEERAIVSSVKGTTRDYIEAQCSIGGIPVRLFDTAGLRESSDSIEEEGIKRSHTLLQSADIIIYLVDSTEPVPDSLIQNDARCISVASKADLIKLQNKDWINLSVKTGKGFEELCQKIETYLKKDKEQTSDSSLVIESERQKENLENAKQALFDAKEHLNQNLPLDIVTMDIQEALQNLGEITGEVTTDDILDKIFSTFCVGK